MKFYNNMIKIGELMRFYPYESAHASDFNIEIDDKDMQWYNAIEKLLSKYVPYLFVGCEDNYFHLKMDNKITLEVSSILSIDKIPMSMYITYWDSKVYLSMTKSWISKSKMYCTVKPK